MSKKFQNPEEETFQYIKDGLKLDEYTNEEKTQVNCVIVNCYDDGDISVPSFIAVNDTLHTIVEPSPDMQSVRNNVVLLQRICDSVKEKYAADCLYLILVNPPIEVALCVKSLIHCRIAIGRADEKHRLISAFNMFSELS